MIFKKKYSRAELIAASIGMLILLLSSCAPPLGPPVDIKIIMHLDTAVCTDTQCKLFKATEDGSDSYCIEDGQLAIKDDTNEKENAVCQNGEIRYCDENDNEWYYDGHCCIKEPNGGEYNYVIKDCSSENDIANFMCSQKIEGDMCGKQCPLSHCENLEDNNGLPLDSFVSLPDFDGICRPNENGLFCEIGHCLSDKAFAYSPECLDQDSDSIIDSFELEECKKTPPGCDICTDIEIDTVEHPTCNSGSIWCAENKDAPFCNSVCKVTDDAYGGILGPLNFEVIITPCGFDATAVDLARFEGYVYKISKAFAETEPFKSFRNNYRISYVFDTRKSEYKGFSMKGNQKIGDDRLKCDSEGQGFEKSAEIATICGFNKDGNSVILDIAKDSGEAHGAYWYKYGVIGSGIPWCCGIIEGCCGRVDNSWDADVAFTALHEVGHNFKLGHSYGFSPEDMARTEEVYEAQGKGDIVNSQFTDYGSKNDYYSPKITPISEDNYVSKPCPIWDKDIDIEYENWAAINGQKIECLPGYDDRKFSYSSLDEGTIMSGNRELPFKYDPVSAKLISDGLEEGYDLYLEKTYSHRCEDLENQGLKELCIAKACAFVPDKEECCSEVNDIELHESCLLGDIYEISAIEEQSELTAPRIDSNDPTTLILPSPGIIPFSINCQGDGASCGLVSDETAAGKKIDSDYIDFNYPNPRISFLFVPQLQFKKGLKMHVTMDNDYYTTSTDIDVKFLDSNYGCHFNYAEVMQLPGDAGSFMLIDIFEECKLFAVNDDKILSVDFKPMASTGFNYISDISFYYDE